MIRALAGHSLTYTAATIVSRGSQMLMLLLLPLLLSPADYGAVQMIATVAILAHTLVALEVSQGLARHFATAEKTDQLLYSSTAWWFTAALIAVWLVMAFALQRPLTNLILGDAAYLTAFQFGLFLIALNLFFFLLQNQSRFAFDAKGYAWISIVFAVVTMLGALGLGMIMTPALHGVLLGQVLGAFAGVALGVVRLRGLLKLQFSSAKLKQMLIFSLPLVPANLALFANVHSSRLILNDLATLNEVGVFTFAAQIGAIASLAILGVTAALTPLILAHHEDPATPPTLARLFEGFSAVSIVLCLILGLLAPELIRLIGNPGYSAAGPLVIIMAPAFLLNQMYVFAPGFAIAKKTTHQLFVALISGVVGISANYVLVLKFGIVGAAVASLLSASIFLTLWFLLSQRLYPIPVQWGRIGLGVTAGVAIAIAGFAVPSVSVVVVILYKAGLAALALGICVAIGLLPGPVRLLRLAITQVASRSRPQE